MGGCKEGIPPLFVNQQVWSGSMHVALCIMHVAVVHAVDTLGTHTSHATGVPKFSCVLAYLSLSNFASDAMGDRG